MSWLNITAKELRNVVNKLSLEESKTSRRSPHPVYWYYLDGKRALRIILPNIHGGSGSISTGFLGKIKGSFLLKNQEFIDLVECPMSSDQFEEIVRSRIEK